MTRGPGPAVTMRLSSLIIGLFAFLPLAAPAAGLENRLKAHPSPYLALHGNDPVAWQEWNAATVARARQEGKLLYVSIGYFSCHWCHVMQKESYQNAGIARVLNQYFIPVKVDRELEPALDQRLIDFAERTRGMSGWPLNAFVTPDGHPLYATLYHPPAEFLKVVQRVEELWRNDRARLDELARIEDVKPTGPGKPVVDPGQARRHAEQVTAALLKDADRVQGGFGEQSKFPSAPQMAFLLNRLEARPDAGLKEYLELTFDAMARLGLHDHLGGGFFRYTVDPSWKTPHFEKMLYDNAQLATLYWRAARVLKREAYRTIAQRTVDFMLRELQLANGGFAASLSALDDQGLEGGYYLWSASQLETLLTPDEREVYRRHAGMTDAPSFESGWLPLATLPVADTAKALKREPAEVEKLIDTAETKLRAARSQRGLPRDPKMLAAWNGLALTALAAATKETGDKHYREAGARLRDILARRLWDGSALTRSQVDGKSGGTAALEDYAYVARGLADWGAITGANADFELARAIARSAWKRFYDDKGWRLEERSLLATEYGQDVVADGHLPSPSAILIDSSLLIAARLKDAALRRQALSAANSGHAFIDAAPFWHASTVTAQLRATGVTAKGD